MRQILEIMAAPRQEAGKSTLVTLALSTGVALTGKLVDNDDLMVFSYALAAGSLIAYGLAYASIKALGRKW